MEGGENGDMHTVMENFQKKNNLVTGRTHVTHHPQVTASSQVIISDICFPPPFFSDRQIFAQTYRLRENVYTPIARQRYITRIFSRVFYATTIFC